jgi:sugar lactone lactonase YvrE
MARRIALFMLVAWLGGPRSVHAAVVIYASDFSGGRLWRLDGGTKSVLVGGLSQPMAAAFGPDGNLYVAQQSGQRVARYTPGGAAVGAAFGTSRYYTGLAFGPDGRAYANGTDGSFLTGRVERFDPTSGAAAGIGIVPSDAAGFAGPLSNGYFEGIAFGPDGNLFVASHYAAAVLVYGGPGAGTPGALLRTLAGVDKPVGLAFGPDGLLYATEQDRNRVVRWDGSAFAPFAAGANLATPIGLGFGPDGDLYVANYTGGNIAHFRGPMGTAPGTFVGTFASGIGNPGYLLVVPEPGMMAVGVLAAIVLCMGRRRRRVALFPCDCRSSND